MGAVSDLVPHRAWIALGSNMGNREAVMMEAVRRLHCPSHTRVVRCSSLYETAPVGYVEQPSFLNMVIAVDTLLSPEELFRYMMATEKCMGRTRGIRWGPRILDLDLLLYDRREIHSPDLTVPHPRMWDRGFVIVPLSETIQDQEPWANEVQDAVRKLNGKEGVTPWKMISWHSASGRFAN